MSNGDYGYFGKGDTGYAQYMTAFNRNFGGSSGGGGGGGNHKERTFPIRLSARQDGLTGMQPLKS